MKREDWNAKIGLLDQELDTNGLTITGPKVKLEFVADFEMTASLGSDSFKSSSSFSIKWSVYKGLLLWANTSEEACLI